jgi:flagellar motor switch/type III secretory pathway protein FliN
MTNTEQIARLGDVPAEIDVAVAGSPMSVRELLSLSVGDVIVTPVRAGDSVGLFAGGARIGDGELSRSGGRAVIRMVSLGSKR